MSRNELKDYTYTIEDEFVLSSPTASIQFLGWYLDHDATSEQVIKIEKGTTGDLIFYAKWEEVEVPDVYSKVNYVLNGGTNSSNNPQKYLLIFLCLYILQYYSIRQINLIINS